MDPEDRAELRRIAEVAVLFVLVAVAIIAGAGVLGLAWRVAAWAAGHGG